MAAALAQRSLSSAAGKHILTRGAQRRADNVALRKAIQSPFLNVDMNPFSNPLPPHQRRPPHPALSGAPNAGSASSPMRSAHCACPGHRAPHTGCQQGRTGSAPAGLAHAALQLKAELFGIDDVIDRVINAIRAW